MSVRHALKVRRGAAAVAIAVGLALTTAGCGDGGEDKKAEPSSTSKTGDDGGKDTSATEVPDTSQKIATIKGSNDIVLTLNSARRDAGGFVTVSGQLKNEGKSAFYDMSQWRGTEKEVLPSGISVAGGTLVDKEGKKRYYVLRDTEGRCLCTMGLDKIEPGKPTAVFLQFPAPPDTTTEVDFQLPTFPSATIKISG